MLGSLCHPVNPYRTGLDPPNIKISDSGGLDLEACMPGCWMLEGLEWIGAGDGGDGGDGGIGGDGRRGLEEILTRSSFRSSADCIGLPCTVLNCAWLRLADWTLHTTLHYSVLYCIRADYSFFVTL